MARVRELAKVTRLVEVMVLLLPTVQVSAKVMESKVRMLAKVMESKLRVLVQAGVRVQATLILLLLAMVLVTGLVQVLDAGLVWE